MLISIFRMLSLFLAGVFGTKFVRDLRADDDKDLTGSGVIVSFFLSIFWLLGQL